MDLYLMQIRLAISILIVLLLYSCKDKGIENPTPTKLGSTDPVQYSVKTDKNKYTVGDIITLIFIRKGDNTNLAKLIIENGVQTYNTSLPLYREYSLTLPETFTRQSGNYHISIYSDGHVILNKKFLVLPQTSENLYVITGPRSIKADGNDATMIISIPDDKYGNVVTKGTPISYESIADSKSKNKTIRPVEHQLSYNIIGSKTKATSHYVGVTDQKSFSLEQRIDFVPLWPSKITISNDEYYPYANNKNFINIETEKLLDKHGNQVSEGTYIRYILTDGKGRKSIYNSIVIGGIARVSIKNPSQPTSYTIYAESADGTQSNRIKMDFQSDITSIKYTLSDTTLRVGPLISQLGQYITEGTEVTLIVNGKTYKEEAYKSFAFFELKYISHKKGDKFSIRIAGTELTGIF